jgi:D-alanine-D-alanine ligase
MRTAIVHNRLTDDASEADRDTLVQVSAISAALERLGHQTVQLSCDLDLHALRQALCEARPDLVFNLVESLDGADWLAFFVTALLDRLGLPYTGSPTAAMFLTNHKLLAKQRLREAGLTTPDWLAPAEAAHYQGQSTLGRPGADARFLIKAITEHASVGMDEDCLVRFQDEDQLRSRLQTYQQEAGRAYFAEQYIDGREFNISLLAANDGPQVLPPAEIDFSAYPAGKARIVDYKAKWIEHSFEYNNTPRTFEFPARDAPLLERVSRMAAQCWPLFGLRGYARVDFRVDDRGRPYILEINANPCLSPDSGFPAAGERAGFSYDELVRRIVAAARPADGCP